MSRRRRNETANESAPSKRRRKKDTETDDINLSQAPDFNYRSSSSKEAEVGIVEKVSLKNFMCHNRLDVSFSPHVNFVIGRNGSGKSAIVTALVVGLGGKAAITNRGSTVKGFIKSGKQTAEVEIQLRNRGTDAFKPDEYGESIVVERRFTSDGSSSYKLKSQTGKLISTKRDELNHILDQFNIQVDNPVAILNQDTSRNFLHSKSSSDKYKFFLKATQLEQMKSDYAMANEQRHSTSAIIEKKERTLPSLEEEVLDWEQKFKALSCIEDLKKKLKRLENEMAWALVQEKEQGLEPFKKNLTTEENRLPKFEAKATESKEKVEQCSKQQTEIQAELKVLGDDVKNLQKSRANALTAVKEKKDEHRKAQMAYRQVEGELRTIIKDRDLTLERINEIRNTVQHDYDSDRRERERKISDLEEKAQRFQAQYDTSKHELEQFRAAVSRHKQEVYNQTTEEKAVQQTIQEKNRYRRTLEAARSDRLKRFGTWVPNALKLINEACQKGQFKCRPRGPVGACFKLKDQSWAVSMESCLKSLIHSYCCDNHQDERVLERIFQQVCPAGKRPSIIVRKFKNQVHDVSRFRSGSRNFPTVLDVIDTDDPVILNCLIDQRGVESIILIRDNNEARQVMIKSPPANTNEAFTGVGDQLYCRPTFRYYSNDKTTAQFLTANVEENIAACDVEIQALSVDLQRLVNGSKELKTQLQENQTHERRTQTQLMKLRDNIDSITSNIRELKSVEDPVPVDVATLEEEVESYNLRIDEVENQCKPKKEAVQQVKLQADKAERELKKVESDIQELKEKSEPILDKNNLITQEIQKAQSHKSHFDQKLNEQKKKIKEFNKKMEEYQNELQSDVSKAEMICPERISTRRRARDLDSEINQINRRIAAEENSRGNHEEITRKYYETQNAFTKIKREVQQLKAFIKRLEEMMIRRQQQYFELRRMIAIRTKFFFIVMLSSRNYTGKISFNHSKETLEMSVQPNNPDMSQIPGGKDMKSLSGGERSFATVCFILALWDAMESPFRCLDEFDVFMDMVNRRISMDMMMDVASAQTSRQFIFLTPQDMSQLSTTNNLRIYRMPDPDRSQNSEATQ